MPLFHFEVRTPSHVMSTEGMDLPDGTAARVEAASRIGALLTAHGREFWTDQDWQMDITDATGLILYVINVTAMKAPATAEMP